MAEVSADLESKLNDFRRAERDRALQALALQLQQGKLEIEEEKLVANMHCHTFFSFNAFGYSPTGLAWLAKRRGYRLLGIVDFDVLDGVDEFLVACELLGVRGSAGIETRVFIPEFADREINSPGEPGVSYHMGIGFTSSQVPAEVSSTLKELRCKARQRNLGMIARLNDYLSPVTIDYEKDVLVLTPGGNATERHILQAYIRVAEKIAQDRIDFWAKKLNLPREKVAQLITDGPAFQNTVRSKLMKRGGVGYVQPGPDSFPRVEEYHQFIIACGAIPCVAWLDGTSAGEQSMRELLELLVEKGAGALNIIPDRNWNYVDPEIKRIKVNNLYQVVELAQEMDLPINVGTEMNSYGQKLIDTFEAVELQPVRQAFIDGAHFIYGHTVLQRTLGLGYQSKWASQNLPGRRMRNDFYTQVGYKVCPDQAGIDVLRRLKMPMTPEQILEVLV